MAARDCWAFAISHNFLLFTGFLFSFSLAQVHYAPKSSPGRTQSLTLWDAFLSTSPCSVSSTFLNLSFFLRGGGGTCPNRCVNPSTTHLLVLLHQYLAWTQEHSVCVVLVEENLSKASWERSDFVYSYICITPNLLMKDFFFYWTFRCLMIRSDF